MKKPQGAPSHQEAAFGTRETCQQLTACMAELMWGYKCHVAMETT